MSRDKPSSERAPLCPLCDSRHWAREPHSFKGKKRGESKAPTPTRKRR